MEQGGRILIGNEIVKHINVLRAAGKYSDEAIDLAKEDLEYGLTDEQTKIYLKQNYSIGQMRIISKCLRDNVSDEFIALLQERSLSGNQMQVIVEFYQKGIPIGYIREVIEREDKPVYMKTAFEKVLKEMETLKNSTKEDSGYVQSLIKKIEELVSQIEYQDKRYDTLNEKLTIFETTKKDEELRENLVRENADKDQLLDDQQNQIMKANSTIARFREQIDEKDKELKRMRERIDTLEDKILEHKPLAQAQENGQPLSQSEKAVAKKEAETSALHSTNPPYGVPVYYQIPIADGYGQVVQKAAIESSERKSGGVIGLLSKLCFKKKSRADIVKLVANGDLVPAQLVQIKSAIEKGLTESQLVELINNNVEAEKMKEIIEIAVLENSIQY